MKCGDFKQGIARVKCTNPECNPGRSRTSLFFAAPVLPCTMAALEQHIPQARVHLVRYYGLYSSCTKGVWKTASYIVRLAPKGWIRKQEEQDTVKKDVDIEVESQDVKGSAKRSAWARLINKVYGINLPGRAGALHIPVRSCIYPSMDGRCPNAGGTCDVQGWTNVD